MPRKLPFLLTLVLVVGALAGCATNGGGGGDDNAYRLTTGGSQGVYYAIGNGIAAAVNNDTEVDFTLDASTSDGSVQNVRRLSEGDFQFAMMQNDVAFYAVNGQDQFQGNAYTDLRAVASMYPEMVQVVTLATSGILSLADLEGRTVVLGAPGSGAAVNAGQILNVTGVEADTQYLDLSTAADRLKDGGVDAVFWTGGIPTGAITSISTTHPVRILAIDGEMREQLQAAAPFYASATLPAGTYGGVVTDVETVAVMAILATSADVPAEHVQDLLRIIFEDDRVQQSHAQGENVNLESVFDGLEGIPLHDGARAYFESQDLEVPADA